MPSKAEPPAKAPTPTAANGSAWEVLLAFLQLGLSSFGGPMAHLGYFRSAFVLRRGWLDDRSYADLVALCQLLPGPTSSQVGMALGLQRAGGWGLLAAWVGFTLPSALVLLLFGYGVAATQNIADAGWLRGLQTVAVAVVAQAVWGMARSLCTDLPRAAIALVAVLLSLTLPLAFGQLAVILLAAIAGRALLRAAAPATASTLAFGPSRRAGVTALVLLALLLLGLPLWAWLSGSPTVAMASGVLRAGALVFGGGHVVLPLLQGAVLPTDLVSPSDFLAGYAAAQAVPGPLFTFAAYLGTIANGPLQGALGALIMLVLVFLPGLLLLLGALPFWQGLRLRPGVQASLAGVNAGVVGLLAAALYDPVWTGAIHGGRDVALALAAFTLLQFARLPPLAVVLMGAIAGALWAN